MASAETPLSVLQGVAVYASRLGGGMVRTLTPWSAYAVSIFNHARETLQGIEILLRNNQPNPAFTLSRPLFEEALLLEEYALSEPQARISKIATWYIDSLNRAEGLAREAHRNNGDDHDLQEMLDFIATKRAEVHKACRKAGVDRQLKFLNATEAATRHGRKDDTLNYLMSHQAVHGNDFVHSMSRDKDEDDTVRVGVKPQWLSDGIAGFAARSGLQAVKAFHLIVDEPAHEELKVLADRVGRLSV